MKADKIFLFFSDLACYYVRFWLRILSILTRQEGIKANGKILNPKL